jgi:ketosteroid isomerase-like protein
MDLDLERTQLLKRDAEWAKLASSGQDIDRILSYWTDDARVYPPDMPVVSGKAALRGYVEGALAIPGFNITWSPADAVLSPDGRMACLLSTNAVTLPGATGELVTTRGRAVTVWRKEADGEWRCAVDIWNTAPAGP